MIGASVLFYLPIVREVTLWFGALDAGKETFEMLLRAGANVELYPGALDEMLQPGTVCSAVFGFLIDCVNLCKTFSSLEQNITWK